MLLVSCLRILHQVLDPEDILCFLLKCFIFYIYIYDPFEVIFVWSVRFRLRFLFFVYVYPIFQHNLLKRCSFLHRIAFPLLSKIRWPYMCGFSISEFSILFHWSMCLSHHQYHTVLKLSRVVPPMLLIPKIILTILVFLPFRKYIFTINKYFTMCTYISNHHIVHFKYIKFYLWIIPQ